MIKEIKPVKDFNKIKIKLPSSKSLTQRALLCASLSEGESLILNPLKSEDTELLKEALVKTGVKIKENEKGWNVIGIKKPLLNKEEAHLGNNGTGSRFFLAYASLGKGDWIDITGKPRLYERPVKPLVEALRKLGANIEFLKNQNFFPVRVKEGKIISQKIKIPGDVSSQFISALLLIAPLLPDGLELYIEKKLISASYVDMTLEVMKHFGIKVKKENGFFKVNPGRYTACKIEIEADASSASYFLAIPLLLGRGEVYIENYNPFSKQGDVKFLSYIEKLGAKVEKFEPLGVKVSFEGIPEGGEFNLEDTPDLFPTMCILGAISKGETILRGAPHLRYKETDRIKAMVEELKKLGVEIEELPDGAKIKGTQNLKKALIKTYDDHRIAMSFAILGLKNGLKIENPECVKKSFPEFWEYLEKIYESI
jgi:3-phosphoshikimate 1-carboxyvinyltransferase